MRTTKQSRYEEYLEEQCNEKDMEIKELKELLQPFMEVIADNNNGG